NGTSDRALGTTAKASTTRCTTSSAAFVWSSPETVTVVRPGATATTTPVRVTRATLGSPDDHWTLSGLTRRLPCAGTATWSVSTSPGDSAIGLCSRMATSVCCTTTGAVAGPASRRLAGNRSHPRLRAPPGRTASSRLPPLRRRRRLRRCGGRPDHLDRGLTLARAHARLDDRDPARHTRDRAVVVDPRD